MNRNLTETGRQICLGMAIVWFVITLIVCAIAIFSWLPAFWVAIVPAAGSVLFTVTYILQKKEIGTVQP